MDNENQSVQEIDSQYQQWYLGIDNEAKGPLSLSEAAEFFKNGKASGTTQAWTHGMGDWVDAKTIDALKVFMGPPALKFQPVPPAITFSDLSKNPEKADDFVKSIQTNPTTPTKETKETKEITATRTQGPPDLLGVSDVKWDPKMSFEDLIVAMGLSMEQVQEMVLSAVGMSGHTKASLKIEPLARWGMVRKSDKN